MPFVWSKHALSLAALPLALSLSGCFNVDVSINGEEGVPLSELDLSGAAPAGLILTGSDKVILTQGDELSIDVEGSDEAVAAVRFVLDNGALGITREEELWDSSDKATIRVTMPAPSDITITGSGSVEAQTLAADSDVSVLGSGGFALGTSEVNSLDVHMSGSGSAKFDQINAEALEITVAGSGTLFASGTATDLEVSVAGSGGADLGELKVDRADINIAGSGSVNLQSDGEVEANIMGSGSVIVDGTAKCTQTSMGSGSLRCADGTVNSQG